MNNTLIDNSSDTLKMDSVLIKCFADDKFREIMIATGYWDLPGMVVVYDELKAFLEKENTKLRLIIGKEPMVRLYQQNEPLLRDDFPGQYLKTDINKLTLTADYQKVVDLLLKYCTPESENSKFQIRIYGQGEVEQFLHAKCYIFKGPEDAIGLIGSSNFTQKGLEDNAELNYLETDGLRVSSTQVAVANTKSHLMWFNEKWEQSVPWNKIFLEEVLKPSPIGKKVIEEKVAPEQLKELTPYEVYIKFLQTQWGDFIDEEWSNALESMLPPTIKRLKYQLFAVNQAYSIMHRHHGVIIADVVGLGKTMVGIMLLKRFLTDADAEGRTRNILIVTPPAIKKSWEETFALFDKDQDDKLSNHIDFITTGSIGKLSETEVEIDEDIDNETGDFEEQISSSKKYGLILVDESHKFRNSNTIMYQQLDELIGNTYPQPYVVLLSATPQNNSPEDLKNQIYLFQREHNNTTLEKIDGRKLDTFFVAKNKIFKEHIRNRHSDNTALIEMSRDIRERVLDSLVVRRTRTDIRKFYGDDMQELKFPEIKGPNVLKYEMDEQLSKLFFDTMNMIATFDEETGKIYIDEKNGLGFYRYRAIEYIINPEYKNRYEKRNLTAEATSRRLARIMQILLVKRLESSFSAFKSSLHNLQRYTQNMIEMIDNNHVFICPDIDVNAELYAENHHDPLKRKTLDQCYASIQHKIDIKGGNNYKYNSSDLDPEYLKKLKADKKIIDKLCLAWDATTYDPKLIKFLKELDKTLFADDINNPHGYDPKKLVIFTEAIDTVKELKRHIEGSNGYRVLAITAENRDAMSELIKSNFDANAEVKTDDYDIIITTEVLAEGVNLHRSNVIVNYDTPWNSTRLMQRIGRVNRIGSREDFVHVYNFFPTAQSDAQIDLVHKAHTKLQAFHSLFGEDNRVYSENEEVESYGQDPLSLQHLVDGEESPLEKYVAELKQFKQDYPEEYERIAQLNENLFVSIPSAEHESLFLVRGQSNKGLCITVNNAGTTKDIPVIEMAEKIRCTPDTVSASLPENWNELQRKALDEFSNFFNKMQTGREQKKVTKEAIEIVQKKLLQHYNFSPEVRQLLIKADKLIRKGDVHLSRKIIRFYETVISPQQSLFEMNLTDLEALLETEMEAVRKRVITELNGNPTITLGVAK